jgi:hypothetical protein
MKYFVHRLSGSQTPYLNDFRALRARNLAGLVREDEEHLIEFIKNTPPPQTLYSEVGQDLQESLFQPDDFLSIRNLNAMSNLNISVTKHMISVRTEWSRK